MDVNDHYPKITFSPSPVANTICNELDRDFNDIDFLKEHFIDPDDVDFSIDNINNTHSMYHFPYII